METIKNYNLKNVNKIINDLYHLKKFLILLNILFNPEYIFILISKKIFSLITSLCSLD